MGTRPRFRIGELSVDPLGFEEAIDAVIALAEGPGGLVFTPNVDHVVRAEEEADFREAYARTALSLADGMPVVWASHLLGEPLPAKVSGSDIFAPLMKRAAERGVPVYLLGGRIGAGDRARALLLAEHPSLQLVGVGPPTKTILEEPARLDEVEREIAFKQARLVVVALGSPLQELWSAKVSPRLPGVALMGLGSVLDVHTGMVSRAPAFLHKNGLEWAYRLAMEPTRLWHRYLVRDPRFATIVAREMARRRRPLPPPPRPSLPPEDDPPDGL